jgi:hypothetical protein
MKFCAYNNWKCKTNHKSVGPISPTVLGAVGPEQYQFLYCIDSHPTAAALCWADWPNTPPPPVILCWADWPNTAPPPYSAGGTQPPAPSLAGGGLSLWQFRHTCWANCSTCSRLTLSKTAMRDGVNRWNCSRQKRVVCTAVILWSKQRQILLLPQRSSTSSTTLIPRATPATTGNLREQQIQLIRNNGKAKKDSDWSESQEDILESAERTVESSKYQHLLPAPPSKSVNW